MRGLGRRLREAKGPRAFAFEVLVVVVGVLIALGAQELVDDWNWSRKASAAEMRLRLAQQEEFANLREFVTVAPCIRAQIAGLRSALLEGRARGPFGKLHRDAGGTFLIRTPVRTYDKDTWIAVNQEGTASHLDDDRRPMFLAYYSSLPSYVAIEEKMAEMGNALQVLTQPVPLADSSRVDLLSKLGTLDGYVDDNALNGRQLLATIAMLGNESDKPVDFSGTEKFCRESGLPLADWKRELAIGMGEMK